MMLRSKIETEETCMSEKTNSSNGGIGFVGLLTILFIGLKLTGYIDWSWWWVLAPIWITTMVVVAIVAVVFVVVTRK